MTTPTTLPVMERALSLQRGQLDMLALELLDGLLANPLWTETHGTAGSFIEWQLADILVLIVGTFCIAHWSPTPAEVQATAGYFGKCRLGPDMEAKERSALYPSRWIRHI